MPANNILEKDDNVHNIDHGNCIMQIQNLEEKYNDLLQKYNNGDNIKDILSYEILKQNPAYNSVVDVNIRLFKI